MNFPPIHLERFAITFKEESIKIGYPYIEETYHVARNSMERSRESIP